MSVNAVSQRSIAVVLLALFLGMSFSPFGELWIEQAEAAEVARHTYEFSDGTTEYIALYQGGNADSGAKIALPKGAQVTDVQMTLSGASATGWSSIPTTTRDHWVAGEASNTDNQSADLTLAMANSSHAFNAHGMDEDINPSSTAWLDNGTYAVRQPHTSNSTDALFSQQLKLSPNSLNAQGQGAVLRHHDWLYLSTWSSTSFHNIVHRLYPNNGTRESIITLDQNGCTLPNKHSSSYYGQWGFRDWVVTDDERFTLSCPATSTSTRQLRIRCIIVFLNSTYRMRTNGFASIRSSHKATVITQALLMTPSKIPFGFFTIRTDEFNPTL